MRLTITETPIFAEALKKDEARAKVPALAVFRDHFGALVLGTMISIIAYALFYLMSVFSLSWGTSQLGYTRNEFLVMQLFAILFFAATIPHRRHPRRERPAPRDDLDDDRRVRLRLRDAAAVRVRQRRHAGHAVPRVLR